LRLPDDVRHAAADAGFAVTSTRTVTLPSGKSFAVLSFGA
jgi:hypothetical protein